MTSTIPDSQSDVAARVAELEARLAIVEEVGRALAGQPDLGAVTELAGERLHDLFPETDFFIALYDEATNMISFPYEWGEGKRLHSDSIEATAGLTARVVKTRAILHLRSDAELLALDPINVPDAPGTSQSWLGVPMIAGDDLIGVLALESHEPDAFDESDVSFASTLASTTATALYNAKLFAETTQRNAELAVIN